MTHVITPKQEVLHIFRTLQIFLTIAASDDDPAPVGAVRYKYHTQAGSPQPIVHI